MNRYAVYAALLLGVLWLSGCGQYEAPEYCPHGVWTNHRSVFPCGEHGIDGVYFKWTAIAVVTIGIPIIWLPLYRGIRRSDREFEEYLWSDSP